VTLDSELRLPSDLLHFIRTCGICRRGVPVLASMLALTSWSAFAAAQGADAASSTGASGNGSSPAKVPSAAPDDGAGQTQAAVRRVTARELANGGADAFDAGEYERALDQFRRAQALFPAPTLAVMEGRCLQQLGRWVEAYEKFNAIARTDLGDRAPEPFRRAVADAQEDAQRLGAKLPRLELRVDPEGGTRVTLNGEQVLPALLNLQRPIDPGSYAVEASRDGVSYFSRAIDVQPEQRVLVEIPLPAAAPPAQAAVVAAPPPPLPRDEPPPSSETPAWVVPAAFAVGGVGAVTAGVSLALAANAKSKLDGVCDPVCPRSYADELSEFRTYRTLFFVGAAVGVVGVGVGGYFTIWGDDDGQLAARVTPAGAELTARF